MNWKKTIVVTVLGILALSTTTAGQASRLWKRSAGDKAYTAVGSFVNVPMGSEQLTAVGQFSSETAGSPVETSLGSFINTPVGVGVGTPVGKSGATAPKKS